MALHPIHPGLRPIHYDAVSAAKVTIVVQPDDELVVSDDIAGQLLAASVQFKDRPKPPEAAKEPAKKAVKKSAKKSAKKSDG